LWSAERRRLCVSQPSEPSSIPKVFSGQRRLGLCDVDPGLWLPVQLLLFLCVSPNAPEPRLRVLREWRQTSDDGYDECDVHRRAGRE
jgi:hypothetical protein